MTGTLPPLLESVVGGGTPGRSCIARLWIQCCCARKSPFAIQKALIAIGGEPKSVKRLVSGDLLIETISALQTKSFLLAKTFLDLPVSISPHKSLNTCRGAISEPDMLTIPDAESLEVISDQAVIQTDENITKIKCSQLKLLQQPSSFPKPNISPSIPSTSASSAQADLSTSISPIADISESELVNLIPNNIPSTSNVSAFPSNSSVQPTSASTFIQDSKQKAKTRARKRKKELLKKMNDAIIEIKMTPLTNREKVHLNRIPKTRT
ncbi:uncharacterized protein TNCV_4370161 [Trichonephila clavipes]|nr:uncharacterized protein TNCV_4370161 [Trichonephila clavipes]